MNPKIREKKSPIHENADANITCDFGDGDISPSRSCLSNTCDTYIQEEEEEECSLFDPKYKHININTINNHVLLN